jgi:hypothetical protein
MLNGDGPLAPSLLGSVAKFRILSSDGQTINTSDAAASDELGSEHENKSMKNHNGQREWGIFLDTL